MADVAAKLCKQVEFYFSDSNIAKDKFLKGKIAENAEGWVPIQVIANFNRMKQLSTDITVITDALKAWDSENLEVSEDGANIRRTKPAPGEYDDTPNSLYAKGFPTDIAQGALEEFWAGVSDKVKAVRIRRTFKTKDQKDSCFVELTDPEERDRVLGQELKFGETPLTMEAKAAYFERKRAERKEMWANKKKQDKQAEEEQSMEANFVPNAIIHFALPEAAEGLKREAIKDAFGKFGTVAWVDFNMGDKEGHVRLEGEAAETMKKFQDEKTTMGGVEPTLRVLEGDEEKAYWRTIIQGRKNLKKGGRNQHHQQKRGTKRSAEDEGDDAPAEKSAKTDA